MTIYSLSIAKTFFKNHPRAGEKTNFWEKIMAYEKNHTLRGNYDSWKRKIDKVNEGKAMIKLFEWTADPYRSKQEVLALLTGGEVGIQKIEFDRLGIKIDGELVPLPMARLAANDGLEYNDFIAWFKKYDLRKPMALINFFDFKYFKI